MQKKVLIAVFIAVFINMLFPVSVIAGDIPESALLDADFCFIGEVQKYENSVCTIKISEVLFGEYLQETIEIEDLKYWEAIGKYSVPEKGDYCAVAVKKSDGEYIVYEGLAAKADSLDKNKLKLESSCEFIERMNVYINNGWYSNQNLEEINRKIKGNSQTVANSIEESPIPDKAANTVGNMTENNNIVAQQDSESTQKNNVNIWPIVGTVLLMFAVTVNIIVAQKLRKEKK